MKIIRLKVWDENESGAFLSAEAAPLIKTRPCLVKEYTLTGSDGQHAKLVAFPQESPPLVFIDPQAPDWTETATEQLNLFP